MSKLSINNLDFSNLQAGGGRIILDLIYPVGIIIEFDSNTNPNNIMLGQQWEEFGAGRVLLGTGKAPENNSITYNLDDKGGSKDAVVVSHNHEAPEYIYGTQWGDVNHLYNRTLVHQNTSGHLGSSNDHAIVWNEGDYQHVVRLEGTTTTSNGVSGTNKNMPPYIAIKRWKRIK